MSLLGFPTKDRDKDDFYPTPEWATQALVDALGVEYFKDYVWEPACGNGVMSNVLLRNGCVVRSSDVVDRGYGDVEDFLEAVEAKGCKTIVTNPPFKQANEFILKALSLDGVERVCMFLRLSFLEGQKRKDLFEKHPPKYVHVFSKRVSFGRADSAEKNMNAVAYAWFVWEKGFNGEPIIRWI